MRVIILSLLCCIGFTQHSYAIFGIGDITFDPGNFAQSIINTTKNVLQTSSTASNMINNFKETKKIYDQSKEYYDALRSVKNVIQDAKKVKETILMVGDISEVYVESFQLMMQDDNFTVEELSGIALGYTKLLEASNDVISELKEVVNLETLQMSDKERMEVVDKCYYEVRQYRNLVMYYTNKNVSVSYLRSKKKGDTDRVMNLYGDINQRYW